jgi:hypothetical protein
MNIFFQILGWLGAFGLLAAFFLNSRKIISSDSKAYQWINLICALMLMANAFHINSYPFMVINGFWAIVALMAIFRSPEKIAAK